MTDLDHLMAERCRIANQLRNGTFSNYVESLTDHHRQMCDLGSTTYATDYEVAVDGSIIVPLSNGKWIAQSPSGKVTRGNINTDLTEQQMANQYVEIFVDSVKHESDAAFLIVTEDGSEEWLPFSQMENPDDLEVDDTELTVSVTRWIADKKEIPHA